MENEERGPVKKVSKQNNQKRRKGIVAIGAVFVVACAFSYLAGTQQQTSRFSPMFGSANGNQYVKSSAQNTALANMGGNSANQNPAVTNNQLTQDNSNSGTGNISQNGGQTDFANQGTAGNGVNARGNFGQGQTFGGGGYGQGFGGREGGRGRHGGGGGFAPAGNYGGTIAQNGGNGNFQGNNSNVTGTYSANVQRCCATGKTGTCHS